MEDNDSDSGVLLGQTDSSHNDSDSAVILESGSNSLKCFGVNPLYDEEEEDSKGETETVIESSAKCSPSKTNLCRSVSDVFNKPGHNLKKSVSEGNLVHIIREEESPFKRNFDRRFPLRHQRKDKKGWITDKHKDRRISGSHFHRQDK